MKLQMEKLDTMGKRSLNQFYLLCLAVIALSTLLLFQGRSAKVLWLQINGGMIILLVIKLCRHYQKPVAKIKDEDYDTFDKLNAIIKESPGEADYYYRRGVLHHDMCQYDEAMANLNKAIELDDRHALAFKERAIVWMIDFHYESAEADLDRALELGFDDEVDASLAYQKRGMVRYNLADYEGAVDDCNASLKIIPDVDDVLALHTDAKKMLNKHFNHEG